MIDWLAWHDVYDDPESAFAHWLAAVQEQVRRALEEQGGAT